MPHPCHIDVAIAKAFIVWHRSLLNKGVSQMEIIIEKWPGERGRKKILVDGVEYGAVFMTQHGCHGPRYHFVQKGGDAITEEQDQEGRKFYRPRLVEVHKSKWRNEDTRTIEEIIAAKARELIESGLLLSPEAFEAKEAKALAETREAIIEYDRRQREKAIAKANAILEKWNLGEMSTLAGEIADAIQVGIV